MAERAGWRTDALKRGAGDAERRFLASGASVAVVDARGALDEGLAAVRRLADPVETNAAALLVLLSRGDVAALEAVHAAGATHYLASPFGEAEFAQMLRFADRHADRLARGRPRAAIVPSGDQDGVRNRRSRDALTGLADGAALRRWIDRQLKQGAAAGLDGPSCVAMLLSVTRFEAINAAFGTSAGDKALQAVARRIERQLDPAEARRGCVARVAGAEFAVALAAPVTIDDARRIAADLEDAIARPFAVDQHVIALSCRIGIACADAADQGAALLRRASLALAEAKTGDGGRALALDAGGEARAAHDSRLEVDLRAALDRDEIGILFQPQVSVTSGAIVGVEALARWHHPERGALGAATLFAAAERSDYLVQLSEHVQRKAIRMAAGWQGALADLRLAVNVTAADIARPGFAARLLAMVDDEGFPRARLTVEVTESGLIDDLGQAAAFLGELRAAGLRVAIDDFGTGYSSLAYLKALPLDYLKIDQRLAQDITGSARDRVVVRGVIEMARSLGLAVIAEGVETEEQLALLAAEGCNIYQGFLRAPPLDEGALQQLMSE
ncbi:diguanylate cyclase/phosphodiesterase [Sphingomonas laterariae]|uniref:Diguanylate cyclase/phosphodiesterase n=1 Tax=Edaphosphingomonas laterariae TaxID=861865 RepID=A0A239EEQ2_9SPHN|nr:bifunctional diguanylate cyclase/phosphodiesterase [Sphingomonas laterariae]SNS42768.1 diguanylate cyclase/phosphodiesterase [Sphingomonas laterariae]